VDVRKKLPASHIVEYTKAKKKKAIIKKKLKKLQDVLEPPSLTPSPSNRRYLPPPIIATPSETLLPTFSYAIIHATK